MTGRSPPERPTVAECVLCTAEHTGTALVCHRCATAVERRLREAAADVGELDITIARLDRRGDPTPRAGKPAPAAPIRPDSGTLRHYADQATGWAAGLPYSEAASDAAWVVRNTVTTWARVIADTVHADPPTDLDDLMRWVAGRCSWLRYEPCGDEALAELDHAAQLVWRAIDRTGVERRYLGPCVCGTDLYARRSAETVTCTGCGTPLDVATLVAGLEEIVRDRSFTAAEIEDAYGIRADRIRKWASRGRIVARGHDRAGRPLYALPEVLELARPARAA